MKRILIGVLFLNFAGLYAQTIDTAILGIVSDSSGAVVAGAAVTITQAATGIKRTAETNSERSCGFARTPDTAAATEYLRAPARAG